MLERAVPADAPAIWNLYRAAAEKGRADGSCVWVEGYPSTDFIDEDIAAGALWLLREDGATRAAASVLPDDDLDDLPNIWTDCSFRVLSRLCVSPGMQGKGLGARVVGEVMKALRADGIESLRLLCDVHNPNARRLYEKLGFQNLGEADMYGSRFILFERILSGAEEGEAIEGLDGDLPCAAG